MPRCQTILRTLRQKGYRLTPQREMVIEAIAHGGRHMTAEEVFAEVQQRTSAVNIATVYRTLDLLLSEGLVTRVVLGDGRLVYATTEHGPHVHLLCRKCGRAIEAGDGLVTALGLQLQAQYGFGADLQHISIQGLCRDCQAAGGATGAGTEAVGRKALEGGGGAHS